MSRLSLRKSGSRTLPGYGVSQQLDAPCLYGLKLTLTTGQGSDELTTRFGFRTARFSAEGFFLNGKKLKDSQP